MKEEFLNKMKEIRYGLAAELKEFVDCKFKELKKELGFANGGVVDHGKLKQSMGKTSHDFNPVGLQNIEVKDCTKLEVEKLLKIFKKKQEIYKFNRDNFEEISNWSNGEVGNFLIPKHPNGIATCKIETKEGVMEAKEGDYIIKGVEGEFYPCKPDIFNKTYEKVN